MAALSYAVGLGQFDGRGDRLENEEPFRHLPAGVVARQKVQQGMDESVAAAWPIGVPCLDLVDDGADQDRDVADGFGFGLRIRVYRIAIMQHRAERRRRQLHRPACARLASQVSQHRFPDFGNAKVGRIRRQIGNQPGEPLKDRALAHGCGGAGTGTGSIAATRSRSGGGSSTGPSGAVCTMYGASTGNCVSGSFACV